MQHRSGPASNETAASATRVTLEPGTEVIVRASSTRAVQSDTGSVHRGYVIIQTPQSYRKWGGWHPTDWQSLEGRLGTKIAGRLGELGLRLERASTLEEAERLWQIRHVTPMPVHRY